MYQYEFRQTPNYTPASQAKAVWGKPRTIELGAGHWWGDPNAGYGHDGVVNTLCNPSRQASAHFVVSAGRCTQLLNLQDASWATNSANPFTVSIEVDPRLYLGGDLANQIMQTLAEVIADRIIPLYGNLEWFPHKHWWSTQCNPLDWGAIRNKAMDVYNQNNTPEWKKNLKQITPVTLVAVRDGCPLRDLTNPSVIVKTYSKGTSMEFIAQTVVGGYPYYLTRYSYENGIGNGFDTYEFEQPEPEWKKNLVDIEPVKLMVMVEQTPIVELNTGETLKMLGQGTWVDFTKRTVVGGIEYYISSYSATNGMPNGIKKSDVGFPAEPPNEKPEWLEKWLDIEDVTMYTRADTDLVNLLDGTTIKTIVRGTPVEIASATEWHGKKYMITKYSTDNELPQGISLDDLDMKPVVDDNPPQPDPNQPDINDVVKRLGILEAIVKAITDFLSTIFKSWR